jgi:predicted dehydrogenase/threonine dehydrogenase-like Zn-dependent dehydrogenase
VLQIVQNYRSGEVALRTVPAPRCPRNGLLVQTSASLISIGTERSMVDLGRKSLIGKARARPDLARRALEKARREGFWKVFQDSLARLDTPSPLGYSSAGVVLEVGDSVTGFAPGDRVACIGQGVASHAEIVSVPINMAARIPDNVTDEEAAFGMVGVIALHGVREAHLTFGSKVAVIGLGLLGLITVQLLRAYGCQVIAMDLDQAKCDLAKGFGASAATTSKDELLEISNRLSDGFGQDAVLVTAATSSDAPINTAIELSRPKARIVLVGVADIHPNRNEMWHKEVEIIVSKAGGPGTLDPLYELDGIDHPIGYVRWTQTRNVEELLRLASEKRLDFGRLITHRYTIADAETAYREHLGDARTSAIGVIVNYQKTPSTKREVVLAANSSVKRDGALRLAVLGAGQFGRTTLLPALAKAQDVSLLVLATSSGVSAEHSGRRFGFAEVSTESDAVFARSDIDAVFALTPHSHHARAVKLAIESNKPLFVEKPLCISPDELTEIEAAWNAAAHRPIIMVGHNRRYSPHADKLREWLKGRQGPLVMDVRVNAGYVPPEHWVHSEAQGRSRIIGEMTHFLDFMEAVSGTAIIEVGAMRTDGGSRIVLDNDNVAVNVRFADGSVGSLVYCGQGPRSYPREHFEIFFDGRAVTSLDFRQSLLFNAKGQTKFSSGAQDYGYVAEIAAFLTAAKGGISILPDFATDLRIMRAAFAIEASLATGAPVKVG